MTYHDQSSDRPPRASAEKGSGFLIHRASLSKTALFSVVGRFWHAEESEVRRLFEEIVGDTRGTV